MDRCYIVEHILFEFYPEWSQLSKSILGDSLPCFVKVKESWLTTYEHSLRALTINVYVSSNVINSCSRIRRMLTTHVHVYRSN